MNNVYENYIYKNFYMYLFKNNHEIKFCCPKLQSKDTVLNDYYYNAIVKSISRDTFNKKNGSDGYYLGEKNGMVMIEHFEFDASKNKNRKGSEYKRQIGDMQNKGITEANLTHKESKVNYLCNGLNVIKSHYNKITSYYNNLIQEGILIAGMQIKVVFLIEDIIPMPCFLKTANGFEPINLLKIQEFLDEFKRMPLISAIFLSINNVNPIVYKLTHELITEYEKVKYSINDIELVPQLDAKIAMEPIVVDRFGNLKPTVVIKTDIAKKLLYKYDE